MGNKGNVSYNTREIIVTYIKVDINNRMVFQVKQLCHRSGF